MNPVNVVIDTNVLIAALKSRQGASYKLLISLVNEMYQPNISVPLFVEYESVAKREGLVVGLEENDINTILDYILSKSAIQKIFYLWRPYLKDIKDDIVLEVAVASRSKYIITFNKKDYQGVERFAIKALTPKEFLLEQDILI